MPPARFGIQTVREKVHPLNSTHHASPGCTNGNHSRVFLRPSLYANRTALRYDGAGGSCRFTWPREPKLLPVFPRGTRRQDAIKNRTPGRGRPPPRLRSSRSYGTFPGDELRRPLDYPTHARIELAPRCPKKLAANPCSASSHRRDGRRLHCHENITVWFGVGAPPPCSHARQVHFVTRVITAANNGPARTS